MNYAHEKHLILETKLQAVEGPFILRGLSWFQRTWWNRKGAYWETCGQSRREQKIHLAINGDNLVQKSWLTYCFETGSQVAQSWPCAPSVASFLPPFLQCWGVHVFTTTFSFCSTRDKIQGAPRVRQALCAPSYTRSSGKEFGAELWKLLETVFGSLRGHSLCVAVWCVTATVKRRKTPTSVSCASPTQISGSLQLGSLLTPPKWRGPLAIPEGSRKHLFPFHSAYG